MRLRDFLLGSGLLAVFVLSSHPAQAAYLVTVAGNGGTTSAGDGGQALKASLTPTEIALDPAGNIFVVDGAAVRKIRPDGVIVRVATLPSVGKGLVVAKDGTLFVSLGSSLQRIQPNGAVTTYAETVTALAFGPDGSLYMVDPTHHRIRRMASGAITTFAGNGVSGTCPTGSGAMPATSACLMTPSDVAVGKDNIVWVSDVGAHVVYFVKDGTITQLINDASQPFVPSRIIFRPEAKNTIPDDGYLLGIQGGCCVKEVYARQTSSNPAATLAGFANGFNGDGPASSTQLNGASDIDIDAAGNIVIADTNNHRVRRMRRPNTAAQGANYEMPRNVAGISSDLLWRNRRTGANVKWKDNLASAVAITAVTNPDWEIVASGDFDGDFVSDIFWRNRRSGANTIWDYAHADPVAVPAVTDPNWKVVGAGDFDGDGYSDLLWRNATTGKNVIWLKGSANTKLAVADAPFDWQVAGVGDFWADGKSDILWRNTTTGANAIWRSGNASTRQTISSVGLAWHVAGIGDFDGDGRSDILWRSDTGTDVIWLSGNAQTTRTVATLAPDWVAGSIGDYDADGASDIFWRNPSSGANVIWHSADSNLAAAPASVSPDWVLSANPTP